ncbi:MAG: TRAP transporter small permease subunit [Hyphomicrobiaceae bacterium]|nr:TRAP transporter small permease subunit [Hyphomicrobiaceae bacterium]
MPRPIVAYVRIIDAISHRVGRFAIYLVFAMMAVLLWSSISKTFFTPSLWTVETAQFILVAYYVLGGPYSMQQTDDSHVRMDLFYGNWSPKTKAWVDAFSVICLMFFLVVLLYGAFGSTAYSLGYYGLEPFRFFWDLSVAFVTGGPDAASHVLGTLERSPTAWRPFLWPVKLIMVFGFILMLLQTIAEFFKDIARIRGVDL